MKKRSDKICLISLFMILSIAFVVFAGGCTTTSNTTQTTNPDDDVIVEHETTTVETEAEAPTTVKTASKIEKLLMDKNGIKIYYKGIEDSEYGDEKNILIKIENNSKKKYTVQQRDLSINGYMIDGTISETVEVGKKSNTDISIWESDLDKNDITTITDISLKFHVFNDDDWSDNFDSDTINITIQ